MLRPVAEQMGLDIRTDRSLWKDRAMLELVAAVTHSFDQANVAIIDHHFAAKQFVRHELREQKAAGSRPRTGTDRVSDQRLGHADLAAKIRPDRPATATSSSNFTPWEAPTDDQRALSAAGHGCLRS